MKEDRDKRSEDAVSLTEQDSLIPLRAGIGGGSLLLLTILIIFILVWRKKKIQIHNISLQTGM